MARPTIRFNPWIAGIAALLSLLGSLLAPAVVRMQSYPGLFPGPAAPGFGLPFAAPLFPLLGALFCGLVAGLVPSGQPPRLLYAALGSSASLLWGMLWGGGVTQRGLLAALTIGLLAAGYVAPLHSARPVDTTTVAPRTVIRWAALLPHLLCLLFLLGQTGFSRPFRMMLTIGIVHAVLLVRGEPIALSRPFSASLFLVQAALLVLGTALWPLLPGW
jgi:hypothetical protein